ncbi:hypothetical protein [Dyadobacter pollutisoli]|uniref:Uncharacterized protein n=1 Tax=Dyadobacter pollutisoli TaxID=2910158 RepID=A0A9E8SLA2_9BACT|nr:hypothetical protein [Dyadobacter pollutisoli]WAC13365.1 hypothetical protein ON006_05255 [Dyadobacter pollutisoli]
MLGAVIDLDKCLDLLGTLYLRIARSSYENLVSAAASNGREVPKNKDVPNSKDRLIRELDCAVIENIHLIQKNNGTTPFDSVRGVFVEGEELYDGAGFHEKNHIQLCIRNPNASKGFLFQDRRLTGLSIKGTDKSIVATSCMSATNSGNWI